MIRAIEITFPVDMDMADDFEGKLLDLIDAECKRYEKEHPDRVMWPAGYGAKILWREPEEPDYNESVLSITVSERERYQSEKHCCQYHKDGGDTEAECANTEPRERFSP